MTARIEAYLYGTSEAAMADAVGITVTEPGPVAYTAILPTPSRLADALTTWASLLTASPLAGTYSLTWSTSAQAVTISATGVADFSVVFGGNIGAALGFAPGLYTGLLTYTGTQQALARFDALRGGARVVPHDGVDLREYRHGRHRAVAWSDADVWEATVYGTATQIEALQRSYCAAGRVRFTQAGSAGYAYAEGSGDGYIDGHVLALTDVDVTARRGRGNVRLILGVPRG